jgi:hypothetical protein
MSTNGAISGYEGGLGVYDLVEQGFEQYIKVYNDLGAAVSNGDVYFLDWSKDADSLSPSARPTLVACATSAVPRQVVVVNNIIPNNLPVAGSVPTNSSTGIADTMWGYVQLRGYCPKIKCAATIAIDDFLQGANASQTAADDGTTQTADSFAIAVSAVDDPATGYCAGVMFGTTALIG